MGRRPGEGCVPRGGQRSPKGPPAPCRDLDPRHITDSGRRLRTCHAQSITVEDSFKHCNSHEAATQVRRSIAYVAFVIRWC